jgi:phosphohistidine phosphatase
VARILLLIRHAKAVPDAATDAQRELAARGVRDARAVGRWLLGQELVPDQVVVSPARRTQQTWELAAAELGGVSAPTMTDRRIYENTIESLLEVLHEAAGDTAVLTLVGHNPSMQGLANVLDDGLGDPSSIHEIGTAYPTSGVAVFDVVVEWADLIRGGATLRAFVAPRG